MAFRGARLRRFAAVPRFTTIPSISGTAQSGQTLTGADGVLANASVTSRQWRRDGVAIAGATGTTYALQAADVGHAITFAVTVTSTVNSANTVTAASAPTAAVIA